MTDMLDEQRTWVEVSLDALGHNYNNIRSLLHCKYLAVVKADAYGHGDAVISTALQELGADWFGVATIQEAVSLRKNGIVKPILIFGYTSPTSAALLASEHLTQAVYSQEYGLALKAAAEEAGVTLECHLKLDSGMGRLGFNTQNPHLAEDAKEIMGGNLQLTGTFTHFAVADELSDRSVDFTREQLHRFQEACTHLEQAGISTGLHHCANSAAAILYPETQLDMVRVGISQYGFAPSDELAGKVHLTPLMTFCSTIAMVKEIEVGDTLSYGRIYTADSKRRIATITVGYADGYPRKLGGIAQVIIRGQYAPVVGRVCMDQLMADVTHIPDSCMGDRVILAGSEGDCEVTFEQLAALTDTVHYERICAISRRVPRIYTSDSGNPDHLVLRYSPISPSSHPPL
ncbi:MAG: alanine racemase [Angelakisella sp.]